MITTNIIERRFAGDGLTTAFPVDIEGIPDAPEGARHVAVSLVDAAGAETPLEYGADFSLAAVIVNGFSKAITVTLAAPLAAGLTLVVRRTTPVLSISSYPDDRTPPRQVERDFDNVVKILQEQGTGFAEVKEGVYALTGELAAETAERKEADADLGNRVDGKADAGHTHDTATSSSSGFMSAADKAKLDILAASAGGGELVTEHEQLSGREKPGQHPVGAIEGLAEELADKAGKDELPGLATTAAPGLVKGSVLDAKVTVHPDGTMTVNGFDDKAPIDSPDFTGTPKSGGAELLTNNTQETTTAPVQENWNPTSSVAGGYYYLNDTPTVGPGVAAGTRSLKGLLQKLVDLSHSHGKVRLQIGTNNCNCNCSSYCSDGSDY